MRKKKDPIPRLLGIGVILLLLGVSVCLSFLSNWRWFWGLGIVAVLIGHGITWSVREGLRCYAAKCGIPKREFNISGQQSKFQQLQPLLFGAFERTFFTVLIAFQIPAVGAGLMLWVTVKMLSGWNRLAEDSFEARVRSFNALMMNLISLLFAVLGGLIIHGDIQISFLPWLPCE